MLEYLTYPHSSGTNWTISTVYRGSVQNNMARITDLLKDFTCSKKNKDPDVLTKKASTSCLRKVLKQATISEWKHATFAKKK